MNNRRLLFLPSFLRPYVFIGLSGILAFAPVSFFLRSMKNDLVALEYPINHFMSQCIHNGELPYWFNTWAMGFPLQSNLTWGIYSTPQLLFCTLFNYDIHALHIEYVFFVLLAGWSMFYLLRKHFAVPEKISVVLACCYMLSGFVAGSGQWMLYVTAIAFLPLILHSVLQLLKQPSLKHALIFAALFYLFFTSVYAAFSIISSYALILFVVVYLLSPRVERAGRVKAIKFLSLSAFLILLFCLPCLLSTIELLNHISRGNPIANNAAFFNTNYFPVSGLQSLLLPFASVKMNFIDTEGTMIDSYMGLFVLISLPVAICQTFLKRTRLMVTLLAAALFFLLISMGPVLPIRAALNYLPGFSYFRNAGIFRSYFIFFIVLFLATHFANKTWTAFFSERPLLLKSTIALAAIICLATLVINWPAMKTFSFSSLTNAIKDLNHQQAFFLSAIVQLIFLGIIFFLIWRKQNRLLLTVFVADLIINILLCSPYFIVSSYTPAKVNSILRSEKGFPVQQSVPGATAASLIDDHGNVWNNVNIFSKQVSLGETYRGPLTLNNYPEEISGLKDLNYLRDKRFAFLRNDSNNSALHLLIQRPTHVKLEINSVQADSLTILQNYFKGWKAYYDNKEISIIAGTGAGMTIITPAGKGIVDFRYERKDIWIPALLLHLLMLAFLGWRVWVLAAKRQ